MRPTPRLFTSEEVNTMHLNSDKDAGSGALHHTLGLNPSQASPGNHNHDGKNSRRLKTSDFQSISVNYPPAGGTIGGTPPTFSGTPLFTGTYTKIGSIIHFAFDVDMDNITNFGTGQYYVTLPFPAARNYIFRDGCLHDISANDQYAISGHVLKDSTQLTLLSTASNGKDVHFTHNVPVTLSTTDNFHIAGTYEAVV
jgi:hypothetical protein